MIKVIRVNQARGESPSPAIKKEVILDPVKQEEPKKKGRKKKDAGI